MFEQSLVMMEVTLCKHNLKRQGERIANMHLIFNVPRKYRVNKVRDISERKLQDTLLISFPDIIVVRY